MIPKIVHYCWFGGKELPESAKRCIASWRKFLPGYEIKEWGEGNYDVRTTRYTTEAYERRKWAFVSDYARFDILYREGGLYFDTDVELIRPIDDIIERGAFMGMEENGLVAPGLGLGAEAGMEVYKAVLDHYREACFVNERGEQIEGTVVGHTTGVLEGLGYKKGEGLQQVGGVWIYPSDYFNPLDNATGRLYVTDNTRAIHWYDRSWSNTSKAYTRTTRLLHRLLGKNSLGWLKRLLGRK